MGLNADELRHNTYNVILSGKNDAISLNTGNKHPLPTPLIVLLDTSCAQTITILSLKFIVMATPQAICDLRMCFWSCWICINFQPWKLEIHRHMSEIPCNRMYRLSVSINAFPTRNAKSISKRDGLGYLPIEPELEPFDHFFFFDVGFLSKDGV